MVLGESLALMFWAALQVMTLSNSGKYFPRTQLNLPLHSLSGLTDATAYGDVAAKIA